MNTNLKANIFFQQQLSTATDHFLIICPFITILFLFVSLFHFDQAFMAMTKYFIVQYLFQESISRGVFCLSVVHSQCKSNPTCFSVVYIYSFPHLYFNSCDISVTKTQKYTYSCSGFNSAHIDYYMIFLSLQPKLRQSFVSSYCIASSISNLLSTIHHPQIFFSIAAIQDSLSL